MQDNHRFLRRLPCPLWIFLATVVLVVVAVGLRFGLQFYRQQLAIRAVENVEGTVIFDRGGPDWLRGFLGNEDSLLLDQATAIDFWECDLADTDLKRLKPCLEAFPHLTHVRLVGDDITDDGLRQLTGLSRLQTITILCPRVTEAGVIELNRALPQLWITYSPNES